MTDSERAHILKMIEDGKISAEEGLKLMQALQTDPEDEAPEAEEYVSREDSSAEQASAEAKREFEKRISRFRRLWLIPTIFGLGITLLGAWWMYNIVLAGLSGWFILALAFFLGGVALLSLGAGSRTSRWLYVNVQEKREGASPRRIRLAFPIPTGLLRWGIQTFGHRIPDRERMATDDILKMVFESDALNDPILIDVKEDDEQHVQVYIG